MKAALQRRPRTHAHRRARARQVDRRPAAEFVLLAVARKMFFVRAPAEFARLRALADETVDRPCVDELEPALARIGDLRIALRAMDRLDRELHRKTRPVFALLRLGGALADVARKVDQRLLDPVRNQPGIGAVRRDHRRRPARILLAQPQHFFAQTVVGAPRCRHAGVVVAAEPGLDAGVEIHDAALAAERDQIDARHLDRQVEQEIAMLEQRLEHGLVVLARQRLDVELDAEMLRLLDAAGVAGEDGDALGRHVDVPQQQRQAALTDGTESDNHQPSVKFDVFFLVHLRPCNMYFWRCEV